MGKRATNAGVDRKESRRVSTSPEFRGGGFILSEIPQQVITYQWSVVFFVLFFWVSQSAVAAPVGANDAANAVQGWLRQDHRPLGWNLPSKIKRTETVKDAAGNALYYAVHLAPAGYVIVSGDDTVEPFIAFSARGDFDSSAHQGIAAWINRDLPARMARAGAAGERERKAHRKWRSALATSPNPPPDFETNDYIVLASQVWVAPFIQTLWNQQTDLSGDYACYNFYVPPYGAGNMDNYPCGCVATAMAQVMYYFQYPTEGVGTAAFDFQIYNTNTSASLRGGDGNGGPYQWTNMPLSPNNPISTQAQAIGALCFDAALTVHMQFESGGSGASDSYVNGALENTFQYAYAAYGSANNGLAGASLQAMLNPNLDARLPVILGIEPAGGHEVRSFVMGMATAAPLCFIISIWGGQGTTTFGTPCRTLMLPTTMTISQWSKIASTIFTPMAPGRLSAAALPIQPALLCRAPASPPGTPPSATILRRRPTVTGFTL